MSYKHTCWWGIVIFSVALSAHAYERPTHRELSEKATEESVLKEDNGILKDLGLRSFRDLTQTFPNSNGDSRILLDLVKDGSDFEDNLSLTNLRPINHFFDPTSGDALLPFIAKPSPTWALEDRGQINGFIGIFGVQKYSFADAREYLLKALTSPLETDRNKHFGLAFQTLGHVIHHVQDMAQPQHVRLDPHLRLSDSDRPDWFFENSSGYEKYTQNNPGKLTPLSGLYPPVNAATDTQLTTARAFWHTSNGNGMGLAEFTNRNFVSAGTNFGSSDPARYTSPPLDPNNKQTPTVAQLCAEPNADCPANFLQYPDAVMTFYGTQVEDRYRPYTNAANPRASTESIFDQDLRDTGKPPKFTLNRFNFDAAHQFLIPRAVAYSAGLINYFFRGKIDFVPDPINAGKYTIKNLGAEDITGTFTLYYDAIDGKRYPVAGDAPTETWTGRTIAANGQLDNLSFTPPTNPAPKTPDEYMLVFKGNMGEEKAENGAVGAVIAKLIQQEGATDYVAMTMPNPVPYRGVSIGVVDYGPFVSPFVRSWANYTHNDTNPWSYYTISSAAGWYNLSHSLVGWTTGRSDNTRTTITFSALPYSDPEYYPFGGGYGQTPSGIMARGGQIILWDMPGYPGDSRPINAAALAAAQVAADAENAARIANGIAGKKTYVMASDGTVLASEMQNIAGDQYIAGNTIWNGGSNVWMFEYKQDEYTYHHKLGFAVPEDCIYPGPPVTAPFYIEAHTRPAEWIEDWSVGVTAFKNRRQAQLKKNSDEFIAALKTGFVPGTTDVTRLELQTGKLPLAWEFQIKRDVDVKYNSYAPFNTIGRKTRRTIQYSEVAFSETVQSDTSANLSQAGVKITKREVTLAYQIPVLQPDGTTTTETRSTTITGYLTQTVTQHNNAAGNWLGLSRKDTYENWYNRESTALPAGVPSTIIAGYLNDRTNSRIGIVLNGTVQNGYNADSSNGVPGNPLTYALYNPPYPKWSSTVQASTPDFIAQWHKDAKIEYLEDGIGASNVLNDSALYGVKQIEITPVGLIADGNGNAPAGTALGIFSSGEKGTQAEIYGTAVYNFDWQTGALTFNKWKPLLDANGNEVASKVINLPVGTVFPINNAIITYKGLHWPDVIAALKVRDESLPTATSASDKLLYELIKAINGGL